MLPFFSLFFRVLEGLPLAPTALRSSLFFINPLLNQRRLGMS
jgi:hypothetical protein